MNILDQWSLPAPGRLTGGACHPYSSSQIVLSCVLPHGSRMKMGGGVGWDEEVAPARIPYLRMELRCVIAIIRHGIRTPKQKMKMGDTPKVKSRVF